MEQFSLEKWLENPSRKVVTRTGESVEILNYEVKGKYCIYAKATWQDGEIFNICTTSNGEAYEGEETAYDLFFADEEEKLTEFENTMVSFAHAMFDHLLDVTKEIDIKEWKDKLLNLARKEVLKSLPKWKKANVFVSNECGLVQRDGDLIITINGYQIKVSDLDKLPKE